MECNCIREFYFIFNNIDSRDYNITLIDPLPNFYRPPKQNNEIQVAGRDGTLTLATELYDTYTQRFTCLLKRPCTRELEEEINAYLSGYGELSLPWLNERTYTVNIIDGFEYINLLNYNTHYATFEFSATIQPFKKNINEEFLTYTEFPAQIANLTKFNSMPTIKMYGNGQVDILVNQQLLQVSNVVDYVVIDNQIPAVFKEATSYDVETFGEMPIIFNTGVNRIDTNATKLEISPNWRYL